VQRRRAARPAGAFTLIELLVVVGIIVVVLSVSIISFGPALRSAGTLSGARRMRVALDTARVRAIQYQRNIRFQAQRSQVNPEQPEEWMVTSDAGDTAQQWHRLPEFVSVSVNAGAATWATPPKVITVTFARDGSVSRLVIWQLEPSDPTGPGTQLTPMAAPSIPSPIKIRLDTTRTIKGTGALEEKQQVSRFIEVTPLTGVIKSYGVEDADPSDLPQN
jgi:Tfp pilus assembly protein FimT